MLWTRMALLLSLMAVMMSWLVQSLKGMKCWQVAVDDEDGDFVTDAVAEDDEVSHGDNAGKDLPLKQLLRLDLETDTVTDTNVHVG